ncbi:unnamed protein product [Rotaria sp. Silwood1]|nr:unnamed protein product [Rotaria sp. Silwood1]CAF3410297.1 unnamed protein product [Rotaria sp. Silwood1]CAF3437824.1 unnamed protein product [Rotaria sp. Silwood1]CAF3442143.1 unnamed protein product [Rotaria sp. Silwood1]
MAYCLVFVNTNNGYPLLIRSTNILERNEHSPEMILNLLERPSDNQIPLALIGILTSSYTFSTKFGIQLRSCHTDDCTIHFYEYNDHLLMCLLEPTEYDIPNECTQYKLVLLRTLFNMIIGYEYIDKISQTNPQKLENDLNLVKYYVDTILNDERTFSYGDITQCADTLCGFDRNIMYSCLKQISDHLQCEHVCITLSNRIIASSTGWSRLTQAEQYILTLLIALNDYSNDILPTIRDMPVYLDSIDRSHNYRLLSVRLLGQIYVSILCSTTPKMSEFESIVDRYCHSQTEHIQNLNSLLYPRSFHDNIVFDHNIQALLYINRQTHFCVSTLEPMKSHTPLSRTIKIQRYRLLKQFYMEIVRVETEKLLSFDNTQNESKMNEMYMVNDNDDQIEHKCYFLREQDYFELYVLFNVNIPTIAMRGIAKKTLLILRKNL